METDNKTDKETNITLDTSFRGIRLRKTQKGYTWDIFIDGYDVERLKSLDNTLREQYGGVV